MSRVLMCWLIFLSGDWKHTDVIVDDGVKRFFISVRTGCKRRDLDYSTPINVEKASPIEIDKLQREGWWSIFDASVSRTPANHRAESSRSSSSAKWMINSLHSKVISLNAARRRSFVLVLAGSRPDGWICARIAFKPMVNCEGAKHTYKCNGKQQVNIPLTTPNELNYRFTKCVHESSYITWIIEKF